MYHVGVVGCGYWGPNLVRNLSENRLCSQISICDLDEEKLARLRQTVAVLPEDERRQLMRLVHVYLEISV
jgi:predicted dinucleotide-utilizing enzyme